MITNGSLIDGRNVERFDCVEELGSNAIVIDRRIIGHDDTVFIVMVPSYPHFVVARRLHGQLRVVCRCDMLGEAIERMMKYYLQVL